MNTILIIDDETPYLMAITDMLQSEGYEIIQEKNAGRVFDLMNSRSFDCIIIDALLTPETGFSICRKIKENPAYTDIPIILSIPKDGQYNLNDAITSKGNDCIEKPIIKSDLLKKVNEQILLAEEKYRNKNMKEKYFQLLECEGKSLVIINKKFTILGNNNEFLKFIGVQSSVVGSSLKDILPQNAPIIEELVKSGKGSAEVGNVKLNLAQLGDDYILFIDNEEPKKSIVENVLVEYNSWNKLYSSSDLCGLVDNFINVIKRHLAVSKVYLVELDDNLIRFFPLEEPGTISAEFDAEKTVAAKVIEKGKDYAGNIKKGSFDDWDFLVDQGYKSSLYQVINLAGKVKVICFVHDFSNAYAAPMKDINILIQEFFILYSYMVNKNELESSISDSDDDFPSKVVEHVDQAVVYCKNGEFLYRNKAMQRLFGKGNFENNLISAAINPNDAENVLAFMKNADEPVNLEFNSSDGSLYKITVYPGKEKSTVSVFEDITKSEKFKKALDFHHSLSRILRSNDDINVILKEFRGVVKKYFPAIDAAFIICDDEMSIPVVKSVEGNYSVLRNSMPLSVSGSVFEKLLITKDTIINNDLKSKKICRHEDDYKSYGIVSYIACPVFLRDDIYGSVEIYSQEPNVFNDKHKQLAEMLAEYITQSIINCVINVRLQEKEKIYNTVVELSGEALLTLHESGRIIEANDALMSILGYTAYEARRMNLQDICAANTRWELVLTHSGKYDFRNKPGGIKSLSVSAARINKENYIIILHQSRTD